VDLWLPKNDHTSIRQIILFFDFLFVLGTAISFSFQGLKGPGTFSLAHFEGIVAKMWTTISISYQGFKGPGTFSLAHFEGIVAKMWQ
jgi:hypothetical protein